MTVGKAGLALGDAVSVGSGDERPFRKELVTGTMSSDPILRSDWGWLPLTRGRKIWEEFPRKPERDQRESSGSQEGFKFGAGLGGGGKEGCRWGRNLQLRPRGPTPVEGQQEPLGTYAWMYRTSTREQRRVGVRTRRMLRNCRAGVQGY